MVEVLSMRCLILVFLAVAAAGQSITRYPDAPSEQTVSLRPGQSLVVHEGESVTMSVASTQEIANNTTPSTEAAPKFPINPYVEIGGSANGGGYSLLSATGTVGLNVDTRHFLLESSAIFDAARKTNDGTENNVKGHDITFGSDVFYRLSSGWYFGGGLDWGKTITTNYDKEAAHPAIGGGKDFASFRLQFTYYREKNEITHYPTLVQFTPGPGQAPFSYTCHCGNGVNGFETQLWYPSPMSTHHVFFHATLQTYWFHTTITDPYDTVLTQQQESSRNSSLGLNYSMMYRF